MPAKQRVEQPAGGTQRAGDPQRGNHQQPPGNRGALHAAPAGGACGTQASHGLDDIDAQLAAQAPTKTSIVLLSRSKSCA
jgi:hypothetical protein